MKERNFTSFLGAVALLAGAPNASPTPSADIWNEPPPFPGDRTATSKKGDAKRARKRKLQRQARQRMRKAVR